VSSAQLTIHQFAARSMGSALRLSVVLAAGGRWRARDAWRAVLAEFAETDAALSGFRADSALSVLNRDAGHRQPCGVDTRLYRALATACRATRVTGGRFDPRVYVHLARLDWPGARFGAAAPLPSAPSAEAAGEESWLAREPRGHAVAVTSPLDLGGLGKGLALRWALRRARQALAAPGTSGALLEAGGDIVAFEPSPQGGPWLVSIEDPAGSDDPRAVVTVHFGAICTSSIRIGRWLDPWGQPAHHLIDPATGEPARNGLSAVTVAHRDPAWAEVWSKALFLTGPREVGEAARQRGMAAWWIDTDGVLGMTPAARQRTLWTRDEGALTDYLPDGTIPARIA